MATESSPQRVRPSWLSRLVPFAFGLVLAGGALAVVQALARLNMPWDEAVGRVVLVAVILVGLAGFAQAALRDWLTVKRADPMAAGDSAAEGSRSRGDRYWFTAGVALGGILLAVLTVAHVAIIPSGSTQRFEGVQRGDTPASVADPD